MNDNESIDPFFHDCFPCFSQWLSFASWSPPSEPKPLVAAAAFDKRASLVKGLPGNVVVPKEPSKIRNLGRIWEGFGSILGRSKWIRVYTLLQQATKTAALRCIPSDRDNLPFGSFGGNLPKIFSTFLLVTIPSGKRLQFANLNMAQSK